MYPMNLISSVSITDTWVFRIGFFGINMYMSMYVGKENGSQVSLGGIAD